MLDMLRTSRTYATYANAVKHLYAQVAEAHKAEIRYVIAVTETGRYAPVVFGSKFLYLAHKGITVIAFP